MKTLLVLFLAAFALSAADRRIVWNPDTSELSWTSSTDGKTRYTINLRTRLMTANGKDPKRFSEHEQFQVLSFMMNIESYTIQSEDWHPNPERWQEQHERKQIEKQVLRNLAAVREK